MRTVLRRALSGFFIALFFFLTLVLPFLAASAPSLFPKFFATKYYVFPEVSIDATVHQDGSMSVIERRTYDFQKGDFSFAFREFEHRQPGDIVGFRVSEGDTVYAPFDPFGSLGPLDPGTLQVSDSDDTFRGTWYYSAQNERRTFEIRYTALCAVDAFPDGAHLYWQFVPGGYDKPTAHTRITIHLPGDVPTDVAASARPSTPCSPGDEGAVPPPVKSVATTPLRSGQVRAWGHGPLQGSVSQPNPQTIVLDIRDLKPFQFVEGSVLFPRDAVPLEGPTPSGNGPDLSAGKVHSSAEVLAQEVKLADQANATRGRLHVFEVLWRTLALAFPLLIVALVVVARRRDRVPGVPRTTQDIPEDIHPVDLAVLWGSWHHGLQTVENAYRAELLWLAQQGVIEIAADGQVSDPKDLRIALKEPATQPIDQEFTQYLFGDDGAGPFELSSVKPTGTRTAAFRAWWRDVTGRISRQTSKRHRRWEARVLFWAMVMLAVVAIVSANELHRGRVALVVIEALALWGVGRWFLPPRLPDQLREKVAKWAAFRRYLRRFSSLPDAPALAVVIWEKYLVYATALGVAHRVARQVKALVPQEQLPAPWAGAPPGLNGFLWASSISTQAPPALAVAGGGSSGSGTSWSGGGGSFSSSGGFGGGFSGGGGGGGGGGSGGAG